MSSKNKTEVLIDGKIYTLSGYESEEYLQRVATYINNKLAELKKELAQKDQELYDLKHELISTQIKLEDAAKELEALKEQATEYQKQIVKLETELGK